MRALLQRVKSASVVVESRCVGKIDAGLLVFLGVMQGDTPKDIELMVEKLIHLRIFNDTAGKMNLSLQQMAAEVLVVSQFTLAADCRKGRRPSFLHAAAPEVAAATYDKFIDALKAQKLKVATGQFGAMMQVELVNDGPVTIMLDSQDF